MNHDFGDVRKQTLLPADRAASLPVPRGEEELSTGEGSPPVSPSAVSSPEPDIPSGERDAPEAVPVSVPIPPPGRIWEDVRLRRLAAVGLVLIVGAAILIPRLKSCGSDGGTSGVLPPVGSESEETLAWSAPAESLVTDESAATAPAETEADIGAEESLPSETTPGETIPNESETDRPSDTYPESRPVAEPPTGESTAATAPESAPEESSTVESRPVETPPPLPETASPETLSPDTAPETMPADAFPILSVDLSEPERSVGYIHSTADRLPPSIPAEGTRPWSTAGTPTVLIVHTHPYEGYHDGSDWYDPATGSLSQTDSPSDPDGVVALGAALTRNLREAGVTVIHLRVPVAEGESASATYARTEETVRYYCELYPDIGLVLDLRRSAELTENGEILRTAGEYQGKACAQVRLSVSGDRSTSSVSRDIAVAVALRRALWGEEPTLSRPVWVKSGTGLVGDIDRAAMLTLELGSCGNSYEEAAALVEPLSDAIAALVKK